MGGCRDVDLKFEFEGGCGFELCCVAEVRARCEQTFL
jgi:hypothetical protein